jgi:hypothetical protein
MIRRRKGRGDGRRRILNSTAWRWKRTKRIGTHRMNISSRSNSRSNSSGSRKE